MRTLFWIIVVVAILVIIYISLKLVLSRISYTFDLKEVAITKIKLEDFTEDKAHIPTKVDVNVFNQNRFGITVTDLEFWLFYNRKLVARSQDNKPIDKVNLIKNSTATIPASLDIYVNPNSIDMFARIALKQEIEINYSVRLKLFGIPYTYRNKYKYKR